MGRLQKHQKLNRLIPKKANTKTKKSVLARCYVKRRMRLGHATAALGSETEKFENAGTYMSQRPTGKKHLKKSPKEFQEKTRQTPINSFQYINK